ncbi:hypothetical protein [Planococcus sp. NCCP-2050]|uniref:hypothetical protein n=1 Tax=Planococcus sp. NCCP-2050 TaxID=2944679 RepID=UPI00203C4460|nr:hypothetical protein [Planococcus sp. NCCP-2050]GKW46906.1 hypothetical protein NCCP2050_25980 [Planococcus sp. NCCP-2050]
MNQQVQGDFLLRFGSKYRTIIAAILSLCWTGFGQLYNKQYIKGLSLLGLQVFNAYLILAANMWFFYIFVAAFAVLDAYIVGLKIKK